MSNPEFGGQPSDNEKEQTNEARREQTTTSLERLSTDLGFLPTSRLQELSLIIIQEPEKVTTTIDEWLTEAQSAVDSLSEEQKIKAQIGLIAAQAAMLLRANLDEFGNETIEQAIGMAYQMNLDNIAEQLSQL